MIVKIGEGSLVAREHSHRTAGAELSVSIHSCHISGALVRVCDQAEIRGAMSWYDDSIHQQGDYEETALSTALEFLNIDIDT